MYIEKVELDIQTIPENTMKIRQYNNSTSDFKNLMCNSKHVFIYIKKYLEKYKANWKYL